ncbi:MAG: FAD-dependent oxidoreductase, partial [Deltaproteobacteria bacterium]|nr:FAD-dependent oxidoreductase [Deltaproteobacteria bacterium]
MARKRGHQVTLLERGLRLGGQLMLASIPPHKQNLMKAVEWLEREVRRDGVEIRLNTEGNDENIKNEKPDAVIVATGALPISPDSFTGPRVLTAWEVLSGKETGQKVLILGGGMVGMETAEFLSQKGCQV